MSIQAASLALPSPAVAGHAPVSHHAPTAPTGNGGGDDHATDAAGAVTATRGNTVNTVA